jgi:hypothetical protein
MYDDAHASGSTRESTEERRNEILLNGSIDKPGIAAARRGEIYAPLGRLHLRSGGPSIRGLKKQQKEGKGQRKLLLGSRRLGTDWA